MKLKCTAIYGCLMENFFVREAWQKTCFFVAYKINIYMVDARAARTRDIEK